MDINEWGIIYGTEDEDLKKGGKTYRKIKEDVVEQETDICIIGSGAAGAVLAKELVASETTSGLKVILLEKGGYYEGQDMNQRELEMMPRLWRNGGALFDDNLRIAIAQGCCLGGSTIINDAVCFDPPQNVQDWGAPNVFFTPNEWSVHIKKVNTLLQVSEVTDDELNRNNLMLKKGAVQLGFINDKKNRRNCKNCMQCGFCHLGCHYETKQDVLRTYIDKALHTDLHLRIYCNCAVRTIVYTSGLVEGVEGEFLDSEGNSVGRIRVNAKVFIISAGAINSSKLLLRNGIAQKTAGRGLCLHPSSYVIGDFFPKEIKGNQGIPMAYTIHDFGVTRTQDQTRAWLKDLTRDWPDQTKWTIVDSANFLIEGVFAPIYQFAMALPGSPFQFIELMQRLNNFAMAGILVQDSSIDTNRVALTPTDRACVIYELGDKEVKALAEGIAIVAKMWFRLCAKRVITPHKKMRVIEKEEDIPALYNAILDDPKSLLLVSAHPQSGNRIGSNPENSVVDKDCKVHGFENLFVCDASVFPTSVGVNPQITVMTVASIIASRIAKDWNTKYNGIPLSRSLGKTCAISQPMYCLRDDLSKKFDEFPKPSFPVSNLKAGDLVIPDNWQFLLHTMEIQNDYQWKGFLPRGEGDISSELLLYFGGFWKKFEQKDGWVEGTIHPLGFTAFPIYAKNKAIDGKLNGNDVVVLKYEKFPFNSFCDVLKIVNQNTIIGKAFFDRDVSISEDTKIITISGNEVLTFTMARKYPFEFMTQYDHEMIYNGNQVKKPVLNKIVGIWDGRIVLDSALSDPLFRFQIYERNGNFKCKYLIGGILYGTASIEEQVDHVVMQDSTGNFNHEIKLVNDNIMIGKYDSLFVGQWLPKNLFDLIQLGSDRRYHIPYILNRVGKESAFRGGDVFGYKPRTPDIDFCMEVLQDLGLSE